MKPCPRRRGGVFDLRIVKSPPCPSRGTNIDIRGTYFTNWGGGGGGELIRINTHFKFIDTAHIIIAS